MTSTKMMFLGILIMLMGFALVSATTQMITFRIIGSSSIPGLEYIASAVFVGGFIVSVIGFFRK